MSGKAQFFKCGLRVVFCLVIFLVLINMKKSFNLKEEDNLIATERQVRTHGYSIPDRIIKKNDVETEIDMLQMDALKGETVDLEV